MKEIVRHYLILVAGWVFLILGIAGLFLPFLQGILFILIGLSLLSHEYHWAREILIRLKRRYPKIHKKFKEVKEKSVGRFRKINGSQK